MNLIEITEQKIWDEFVLQNGEQILQSWSWRNFQKILGRKIWCLAVQENNKIISAALIVKHQLSLGRNYFYCPRGPVISDKIAQEKKQEIFKVLLKKIEEIAQKEKVFFFRFEPVMDLKLGINNFRKTKDVQPSKTLILTLAGPEEEILARMHSKTRYNIRLAQKHGVKVSTSNDIEIFLFLLHQTTKRDKFKAHADEYYRHLLSLGPSFVKLYFAEYKNKILAANMMVFFGKTVTYLHGASSNQHRPVMAPHFLHWSIISQVKKDGYAYYDFWGISQKKWPSLTRFKKSFGGRVVDYPGTYDLVLDKKWYFLYKIGKFIKS